MTQEDTRLVYIQREKSKEFFFVSHNRLRKIGTMQVLGAYPEYERHEISAEEAEAMKIGPSVPMKYEGRPEKSGQMREYVLRDCTGEGLEFGAGYSPARVPLSCNMTYVDRYSDEDMLKHSSAARNFQDGAPKTIQIDKVGTFQTMDEFEHDSVDFIYAAHVIEHVSNPIGAILEGIKRLRVGGKFILVIPHRDRTFDANRAVTSIGHLLNDHLYPDSSSLEHCIDRLVYVVARGESMVANLEAAKRDYENQIDMHYHTFTPDSFELIMKYVSEVSDISHYEIDTGEGQGGIEFYMTLTK